MAYYNSLDDLLKLVKKIETHGASSLVAPDPKLEQAISNSKAKGLPPISVSALTGQQLLIQAQLIGAKSVLEIGTLGGYSSIWFARAGAKVTSIEINPKHRDVALENAAGLDVDVILGAALDVLPKLAEEGKTFDMVFIDADWGEQWEYFDWAVKLTRPKGAIIVDNVVRELIESEQAEYTDDLVSKVGKDERVTATLVPTLSSHKNVVQEIFDGYVFAIVKGN
ncbi:S-adenosyl-L-methionine-dependent methyltransferase [Thozetella sp. PMI_491]|nr:S-adenosyl-L-methionine-dependent methyltransferase [Thozetella sp. PMI_491]